jgi:hypothetical protein
VKERLDAHTYNERMWAARRRCVRMLCVITASAAALPNSDRPKLALAALVRLVSPTSRGSAYLVFTCGGVEAAVTIMTVSRSNVTVLTNCCTLLHELASTPSTVRGIRHHPDVSNGTVPLALLTVRRLLPSEPRAVEAAATALWSFAFASGNFIQSTLVRADAHLDLMAAIVRFPTDVPVLYRACGALMALALRNPEAQKVMGEAGAAHLLLETTTAHRELNYGGDFSELRVWMRKYAAENPRPMLKGADGSNWWDNVLETDESAGILPNRNYPLEWNQGRGSAKRGRKLNQRNLVAWVLDHAMLLEVGIANFALLGRRRDQPKPAEALVTDAKVCVPAELATWLSELQLSAHGPRLVADHKLAFVSDCQHLEESELMSSGLARVEAKRFLHAAAKLGGASKRLPPNVQRADEAAPAEVPVPAAGQARASVRALVIGINAYAPVPGALHNAVADAQAVHAALSAFPGAVSTLLTDCSKAQLEQALKEFRDSMMACNEEEEEECISRGMQVTATKAKAASAAPADKVIAIIFFAGHGLQVAGRNYLIPVDFRVPKKNDNAEVMWSDTAHACVSLDLVEMFLGQAVKFFAAGVVLLDCCRNVPDFLAVMGCTRAAGATRALPSGMADFKPKLDNLLVAYATKPGECALDRSRRLASHSPFTAALLHSLEEPRQLNSLSMFLVDEVTRDTSQKQCPQAVATWGSAAGTLILG